MAVALLEIEISQLPDDMQETKFHRETYIFEVQQLNGIGANTIGPKRMWRPPNRNNGFPSSLQGNVKVQFQFLINVTQCYFSGNQYTAIS